MRQAAFAEGARLGCPGPRPGRLPVSPGSRSAELADRAVAVAVREAEEEVADGADAGFGRRLGEFRADARRGPRARRSRTLGRGQWTGASQQLGAAQLARRRRRSAPLLGGQQPPPARLSPLVGLDLDPVGDVGVDLRERDRRPLAGDHGDDLGPLGEVLDRRRQGRAGAAPGDDLAVGEADRVALLEAALGVVAGGRGDAAGGDARRAPPPAARRSRRRRPSGSSSTSASRLACCEVAGTTRAGFSESSQARSAAITTFEELGRTSTSSAATPWIPASSS